MPIVRVFRGRRIKRTKKMGAKHVLIIFCSVDGRTCERELVSLSLYLRERKIGQGSTLIETSVSG